MRKQRWTKLLALALCAGLLLSLCGCGGNGNNEPTGTTTTIPATTTPAATDATDTTATPTDQTTEAPAAPTTDAVPDNTPPTAAPVDTPLQIGGDTFTLDGETFEMGISPDKLLAHLGEPNKLESRPDGQLDATAKYYYYTDIILTTVTNSGTTDEILVAVYFISNRYSFDGISVGDSVDKLDKKLTIQNRFDYGEGLIAGLSYCYDADENDRVRWMFLFPSDEKSQEEFIKNESRVPSGTPITCIRIDYYYYVG